MSSVAVRDALARAELGTMTLRGRPVLGSVLKSVLWTLWANDCGKNQVSVRAISAWSGCDKSTCSIALGCLAAAGVIRKLSGWKCRQRYEIVVCRLREMQSTEVPAKRTNGKEAV